MSKLTKNQKIAYAKVEPEKAYKLTEAAALLKEITFTKFDASVDEDELTEEMRKVLRHEFRHHVEGRAGVRDLEVWDAEQIAMYKEQQADNE